MSTKLSALALPIILIAAPMPVLAQSFEVSITEFETVKKTINKCYFTVEATNVGDTAAALSLVTEHRLTEGTMSAMVTPKNGVFGQIKTTSFREIEPGDSATKKRSFLGADCADVAAVWFEPRCGTDCVAVGAESALPIRIATAEELATRSDAAASDLLVGTWKVRTSDGTEVATIKAKQASVSSGVTGTVSVTDRFCTLYGQAGCPDGMGTEGKIAHSIGVSNKSLVVQFRDNIDTQILISWNNKSVGHATFKQLRTPLIIKKQEK